MQYTLITSLGRSIHGPLYIVFLLYVAFVVSQLLRTCIIYCCYLISLRPVLIKAYLLYQKITPQALSIAAYYRRIMIPAIMTENGDVLRHFDQLSLQGWAVPIHNKFSLKKIPEPLHIESVPSYADSLDQAELEAQTPTAHKPTLKGVGKSDCEVKIVSVSECESEIPPEAFADKNSCMYYVSFCSRAPELMPSA